MAPYVRRKPVNESPPNPSSTQFPPFTNTELNLELSSPGNADYDPERLRNQDHGDQENSASNLHGQAQSQSQIAVEDEESESDSPLSPIKPSIINIGSDPVSEKPKRPSVPIYSKSAAELYTIGSFPDETSKTEKIQEKARDARHTWDRWHLNLRSWGRKDREKAARDIYRKHLESEFGGGTGYQFPFRYQKPAKDRAVEDLEERLIGSNITHSGAKKPFLNPLGQQIWKYEDVDAYLSPSKSVPRRLMVQATSAVLKTRTDATWRRTKVRGTVPLALLMAEWAFRPKHWWSRWLRCIFVALPLQGLLAMPGANAPWEMNDVKDDYHEYPGYHWKWAKHAINPLDMRSDGKIYDKPTREVSSRYRLIRPRRLMVCDNGTWELIEDPPKDLQYIFISYHWGSFSQNKKGDKQVELMARHIAEKHGISAYFLDHKCNAPTTDGDQLTSDVNRMCDVIRGSRFLTILLPDDKVRRKTDWGQRLWTVPEGLLAPGDIHVCTWHGYDSYKEKVLGKVELTSEFWINCEASRILAEHYQGLITLSRLGLFSTAITALSQRTTQKDHTKADMGYALMGLLQYRVEPDPTDDLFQVISRLSLANDNDRLIERMVSMFPPPGLTTDLFKTLAEKDQYDTHLWDIKPRCQVVGVADEPHTIILDECRAVPIRWKCFPRMMYKRHVGFRKKLAELAIRSGAWWTVSAYTLALTTYGPILLSLGDQTHLNSKFIWGVLCLLLGIGIFLSAFAPLCVKRLFGGEILESAPHLIGFEGVMPKDKLEKLVFGNSEDRLDYQPSSTPFGKECKHPYIRKGREPIWIKEERAESHPDLLPGHKLFTLVDTGNMSISIFQARHPPTVAVITGAEGGMLRAVLCSWRFADDCLYKETVMRLPTSCWSQAKPSEWLKMSLQSQDDRFGSSNPLTIRPLSEIPESQGPSIPPTPPPKPKSQYLRSRQSSAGRLASSMRGSRSTSRQKHPSTPVPPPPPMPTSPPAQYSYGASAFAPQSPPPMTYQSPPPTTYQSPPPATHQSPSPTAQQTSPLPAQYSPSLNARPTVPTSKYNTLSSPKSSSTEQRPTGLRTSERVSNERRSNDRRPSEQFSNDRRPSGQSPTQSPTQRTSHERFSVDQQRDQQRGTGYSPQQAPRSPLVHEARLVELPSVATPRVGAGHTPIVTARERAERETETEGS